MIAAARSFVRTLLLVAVVAAAAVAAAIGFGHLKVTPVLTGSMEPTFSPGDLLILRPIDGDDVEVGTVVMARVPEVSTAGIENPWVVHRATELTAGTIKTRGDANPYEDRWDLDRSEPELWEPVQIGRGLGHPIITLESKNVRAGAAALVFLFIALPNAVELLRPPKRSPPARKSTPQPTRTNQPTIDRRRTDPSASAN